MATQKLVDSQTPDSGSTDASSSTIEVLPRAPVPQVPTTQKRRGSARPASVARSSTPRSMNRVMKAPTAARPPRPIQYARRGSKKIHSTPRSTPAPSISSSSKSSSSSTFSSTASSSTPLPSIETERKPIIPVVEFEVPSPAVSSRPVLRTRPAVPPRYIHEPEEEISDAGRAPSPPPPPLIVPRKFVIGLDYGTTFTSVAFVVHDVGDKNPRVSPREVKNIINWPEDGNAGARAQVPTELWYTPVSIPRDVSPDDLDTSDSDEDTDDGDNPRPPHNGNGRNVNDRASRLSSDPNRHIGSTIKHCGWSPVNGDPTEHLWGYGVQYQKYRSNTNRDVMGHIDRPKLMLVSTKHTIEDRKKLRPRLKYLIQKGTIRKHSDTDKISPEDVMDVMIDFLIKVFAHTKQQLIEREGYTADCPVSFVLTVPTIWSARSSRVLQAAVQAAIKFTEFGTLVNGSVENVFIVSEPEAAATFLLGNTHTMLAGETFTVLDCGGGTVDGVTYSVTNTYPLRLKVEVGQPAGDNCGASFLNDAFEARVLKRLENEHYLDCNGETREDIVRYATLEFENRDKRIVDIARRPVGDVKIPGLRGDDPRKLSGSKLKNFKPNYMLMFKEDYDEIFLPLLERTVSVLETQIDGALKLGIELKGKQKVFLIGGFGAAPSLRNFLREYLLKFARQHMLNYDIELIVTNEQDSVTAIAAGATLRALNLEHGPRRRAFSSYGFLRIEPYQPEVEEGHKEATPTIDPFDNCEYVTVVDYFLHKNEIIPPMCRYKPFKSTHAFSIDEKRFNCEELLYVNDSDTGSHYEVNHVMNAGAQEAGRIVVDMTFLRDKGHIDPVIPQADEDGLVHGKPHYQVTYDLVPIVEGRDLKYVARWPPNRSGEIMKAGQISIAAAFRPGTG